MRLERDESARDELALAEAVEAAETELIRALAQSPHAVEALMTVGAQRVTARRRLLRGERNGETGGETGETEADGNVAARDRRLLAALSAHAERLDSRALADELVALRLHRRAMDWLAESVPRDDPHAPAIRSARAKADRARSALVAESLPIAAAVARKYQQRGIELEDLVQEATIGLMRAVDRFDPRRGLRFATYATWWARQQIQRALVENVRTIRVPLHVVQATQHVGFARRVFRAKHGREPSREELLAGGTGTPLDPRLVAMADDAVEQPLRLHDRRSGEAGATGELIDLIRDPAAVHAVDAMLRAEVDVEIARRLATLSPRHQEVIRLRFGLEGGREHTLQEIGERFGISRERVRRIEATALAKLAAAQLGPALIAKRGAA